MSDQYNRYGRDKRHGDSHHGYGHREQGHYMMYLEYAKKILKNKIFLMIALACLLLLLVMGIWVISLLMPLLGQLYVIEKNGIKSAVEAISPYLLKLWEGAGK